MDQGRYRAALTMAVILTGALTLRAADLPSSEEIMKSAVRRAALNPAHSDYSYIKSTVLEELDSHAKVKDRTEEVYQVEVNDNFPRLKLIEIDGRALSRAEAEKEERKEIAEEKEMGRSPSSDEGEPENLLTPAVLRKYRFTLIDEVSLNGRLAYRLDFKPNPGQPAHSLLDRLLTHVAGDVWIDEQEFEIARAEVHLTSEIKLWSGFLGVLKECKFIVEQKRLDNGAWLTSSSSGVFQGRKFISPFFIKMRSEATDFRTNDSPR